MKPVSHTLRLKLSLGISVTLILLLAPLNWVQYELQRRTAMQELELLAATTGSFVVQGLEGAMLSNNRRNIQAVVDSVVDTPEIQSVYILDLEGEVAASPGRNDNGRILHQTSATCQTCHQWPAETRPRGISTLDDEGQPVFRTMTPILNQPACHRCHDQEERLNGVFYMDFSMIGLNARLVQARRTAFWGSLAIIVITALAIYWLLSWLFITRLERVALGMRRFGQGQRSARVVDESDDEVGLLAHVFNEMATTIQLQEEEADRLYSELAASDNNRRHLLKRLISAREEEQQRLSRRIHDVLGQLLTGLSLYLKLAEDQIPEEMSSAKAHLATANDVAQETIDQAHEIMTELRPSALDDYGLIPALQDEAEKRLARRQIDFDLKWEGNVEGLSSEAATASFRIAQEALVNIVRHARADRVWIQFRCTADALIMSIEDDGIGMASADDATATPRNYLGIGITAMHERAAAVGGRVDITARLPKGTRLLLTMPLNQTLSVSEK